MDLNDYMDPGMAATYLGVTKQTIYNLTYRDNDFPRPLEFGSVSLWTAEQLDSWRAKHPKRNRDK